MSVEKTLERKLQIGVKNKGGMALKFISPSLTGVPDRICLAPGGRIWFVELKSTGKKPTPKQILVHTLFRKLGFAVFVIDTPEQLETFLNQI